MRSGADSPFADRMLPPLPPTPPAPPAPAHRNKPRGGDLECGARAMGSHTAGGGEGGEIRNRRNLERQTFGIAEVFQILLRYFSECHFWRSWHAQFHCAQQQPIQMPPGNNRNQPQAHRK